MAKTTFAAWMGSVLALAIGLWPVAALAFNPEPASPASPASQLGPVGGAVSAAYPQRAGRLADFQGGVWIFDTEQGQWSEALRNRALTEGDRVSTDRGARAELRVGSTELRLGAATELEIVRLDDSRMGFQVHRGQLAVRVRSREIAAELELLTAEARFLVQRAGTYRVDREDDSTWATAVRGGLQVQTADQLFNVAAGQRVELTPRGRDGGTLVTWSSPLQDRFADWVAADEQRDDRSASLRYVSPEMTGVEDLDRHGRWERHPEFGMVWSPLVVTAGWAPFQHGRWIWHARWGWTWVDQAPWGFAPFHYGRWVLWGARWVWTPGAWVARPAFAPALVQFSSPSIGVSVVIGPGRPPSHWVPLPPWEPYRPWVGHRPHPVPPPVRPHPVDPGWRPPVAQALPGRPLQEVPAPRPERRPSPVLPAMEARPVPAMPPSPGRIDPPAVRPDRPARVDREGRDRGERVERVERGERAERTERTERTERGERAARPEPAEGRGRSTTEHRPRDQRERAQML